MHALYIIIILFLVVVFCLTDARTRRPPPVATPDDVCRVCRDPSCAASQRWREFWRLLDRDPITAESYEDIHTAREQVAKLIVMDEDACGRYRADPTVITFTLPDGGRHVAVPIPRRLSQRRESIRDLRAKTPVTELITPNGMETERERT